MKKTQCVSNSFRPCYELAASIREDNLNIYGTALDEVIDRHKKSIKKTVSYDLKAIEKGKLAVFMLSQFENFPSNDRRQTMRQITSLFETAIETLVSLENREMSKYRHIIDDMQKGLAAAAEL